jgi:hypothetical protein
MAGTRLDKPGHDGLPIFNPGLTANAVEIQENPTPQNGGFRAERQGAKTIQTGPIQWQSALGRLNAEVTPEKPHHVLFRDGPTEQIALRLRDRA